MDYKEENLEESLKQYKAQLTQVEEISKIDPTEEILQLKSDLQELIQLTEETLLSLKKSKLLSLVDSLTKTQTSQPLDCTEEPTDSEENDGDNEKDDELIGTQCKAPFCHEWGEMSYHNAVICSIEPTENETQMVRVLFCNPTHNSMLPCRHFFGGFCKFEDSECRFSHGHLVSMSDIRPFHEPHHNNYSIGGKCLAKDSGDLWHKATVVDILGQDKVHVMFDSNNRLAVKELQDVLCTSISDDDDTSGDEDTSDDAEGELPVDITDCTIQTSEVLGHWEQHTKGIGSKLMLKMGYMIGQGLGKNSDGRALPVPIEILPQGKSLDKIMELRETKKYLFKPKATGRKVPSKSKKQKRSSIFDVLNSQLSAPKKVKNHPKSETVRHITARDLSKKSEKHINIQLLKTAEELKRSDQEIFKLRDSLERSIQSGDEAMMRKINEKIDNLQKYQDQLRTSEKYMNNQKNSRKAQKELCSF